MADTVGGRRTPQERQFTLSSIIGSADICLHSVKRWKAVEGPVTLSQLGGRSLILYNIKHVDEVHIFPPTFVALPEWPVSEPHVKSSAYKEVDVMESWSTAV